MKAINAEIMDVPEVLSRSGFTLYLSQFEHFCFYIKMQPIEEYM